MNFEYPRISKYLIKVGLFKWSFVFVVVNIKYLEKNHKKVLRPSIRPSEPLIKLPVSRNVKNYTYTDVRSLEYGAILLQRFEYATKVISNYSGKE